VSEFTSWSADFLVRPVRAALSEAGYSPELVQIVTGMAEAGAALAESKVDKIIFTGSDRVGKLVMRAASANLTPCVLELGGKDPFIVCRDVDLDSAVPTALRGTFQNCGQNCIGIERIFVEEPVYDEFVRRCLAAIRSMRQGAPLGKATVDMGAMSMPTACDAIQALVDDAVAKGAKLLAGGKRNAALLPGQFFEPTLLVGVTPEMKIAQDEVFGPVMVIFRPWTDEEQLLKEVNNCPYALGSSIFSNDVARAERIAKRTRAGMANINDFGINYLCQSLPFGGRGASGYDKFAGPEGLRACCAIKSKTHDRIPGVKTSLPEPFRYPVSDEAHLTGQHLIGMAFNPSWAGQAAALVGLIKSLVFYTKPPVTPSKKID
jgi:acyl-CoA reductase-like NAD-dependent aldehyde dehydrogenase